MMKQMRAWDIFDDDYYPPVHSPIVKMDEKFVNILNIEKFRRKK